MGGDIDFMMCKAVRVQANILRRDTHTHILVGEIWNIFTLHAADSERVGWMGGGHIIIIGTLQSEWGEAGGVTAVIYARLCV